MGVLEWGKATPERARKMVGMDAEYETRMKRIEEKHQALAESLELFQLETREGMREIQSSLRTLVELVSNLTEVARLHQGRLDRIEGK